jgi:uncharacterized membrane protein
MKVNQGRHRKLERLLSIVLRYGTALACALVAAGLVSALIDEPARALGMPVPSATSLVTLGIAVILMLPALRVTLMAIAYALEGDYLFVGIATLVLAIIGWGLALGGR